MAATAYLETWLRRTRRQLVGSGRMTQVAAMLAAQDGVPATQWEQMLRSILDGGSSPGIDVLTRIDAILSTPSTRPPPGGRRPTGDQMELM